MPTAEKGIQNLSKTGEQQPVGSAAPSKLRTAPFSEAPDISAEGPSSISASNTDEFATVYVPRVSAHSLLSRVQDPQSRAGFAKVPGREQFWADMDACFSKLSPRAQKIASLDVMGKLQNVPNSAAAMTRFFSFADLDRLCHSKHTASKVWDVHENITKNLNEQRKAGLANQPSPLSDHEVAVLECAALLHDLGHRLGSHALDRALAAHPKAPKIGSYGWEHEFHEFHTARLVAHTRELKEALGPLHSDVLAVLTHCDTRPRGVGTEFETDFGKFAPAKGVRIALLHELVEKVLDRNSCLELDFRRGGMAEWLIEENKALLQKMESALTLFPGEKGDELRIRVNRGQHPKDHPGWISEEDLIAYVSCRQLFREVVAASPGSCNVDVFLREAVWKGLERQGFSLSELNQNSFEFLRNRILRGEYKDLLGPDVLQMLTKAPHDPALLSVEDVIAPLVTMTKDDFSEYSRLLAVPPAEAKEACGVQRTDMTAFELDLREHLRDVRRQAELALNRAVSGEDRSRLQAEIKAASADISVIVTTDIEKIIPYMILEPSPDSEVPFKPGETINVHAVQSSYRAVKIAIAARAIDIEGQPQTLGRTQQLVEEFCRSRDYLKKGCVERYDRHFFAKPFLPEPIAKKIEEARTAMGADREGAGSSLPSRFVDSALALASAFDPEIQARMKKPQLKWELMGQHGLRQSDSLRSSQAK